MNQKLTAPRRAYEVCMRAALYLCAGITCALLVFLIGYICYRGIPGISWSFLTTAESVLNDTMGILPAICNTLYVIIVSLVIVLPLGVGAAIYLTEYARTAAWWPSSSSPTRRCGHPVDHLRLVGNIIFCTSLQMGKTLLAGSLTLVIMVCPPSSARRRRASRRSPSRTGRAPWAWAAASGT